MTGKKGQEFSEAVLRGDWDAVNEKGGDMLPELILIMYGQRKVNKIRAANKKIAAAEAKAKTAKTNAQKKATQKELDNAWEDYVREMTGGKEVKLENQSGQIDSVTSQKAIEAKYHTGKSANFGKAGGFKAQKARLMDYAQKNGIKPGYWVGGNSPPQSYISRLIGQGFSYKFGPVPLPTWHFLPLLFKGQQNEEE